MSGQVDYLEVMSTLGSVAARHAETTGLAYQTYATWEKRFDDIKGLFEKYQKTVHEAQAQGRDPGKLDKAGIAMQLVAQNPWFIQLMVQTLSQWQTRIPDAVKVLNEFQLSSSEAMKS
jgi:hypothetical protein